MVHHLVSCCHNDRNGASALRSAWSGTVPSMYLDCLSQLLILKHIKAGELGDPVHAQHLDHRIAEPALRSLWDALHEQY